MNRLAKLSARFIGNRGFSIGIDDVTPAPKLQTAKKQLMVDGCASSNFGASSQPLHFWLSIDGAVSARRFQRLL